MSCILSILDELIRQVTINCAERGLLLLRYVYMHYCSEKLNEVLFVEYKVQYNYFGLKILQWQVRIEYFIMYGIRCDLSI